MLDRDNTALLIVDVQERMMPAIHKSEEVLREVERLARGCQLLDLPILLTEQYPKGLGHTLESVREILGENFAPIEKLSFSCFREPAVKRALKSNGGKHILLCGVEAHVCVYQTAMDLVADGFQPHLVVDAIGSRSPHNHELAVDKLPRHGVILTSVEMALFELMGSADIPEFKAISKLVR